MRLRLVEMSDVCVWHSLPLFHVVDTPPHDALPVHDSLRHIRPKQHGFQEERTRNRKDGPDVSALSTCDGVNLCSRCVGQRATLFVSASEAASSPALPLNFTRVSSRLPLQLADSLFFRARLRFRSQCQLRYGTARQRGLAWCLPVAFADVRVIRVKEEGKPIASEDSVRWRSAEDGFGVTWCVEDEEREEATAWAPRR